MDRTGGEQINLLESAQDGNKVFDKLLRDLKKIRRASRKYHEGLARGTEVELDEAQKAELRRLGYL